MISIIVSSYKDAYFEQLIVSINSTIGNVPYEVIKVDNPGRYSASSAYNLGAQQAKYDILCFLHEDIIFRCENWGSAIIGHFNCNPLLGLMGVAGSAVKANLPTGWMQNSSFDKINILQHYPWSEPKLISTFRDVSIDFVRSIDGVFMAVQKRIWEQYKFDEEIKGYHLYDLDFSLRISKSYKVGVAYDILLEHLSSGDYRSNEWVEATLRYHKNEANQPLFDQVTTGNHKIRKYYYMVLYNGSISLLNRLRYTMNLGIDASSLISSIKFLAPKASIFLTRILNGMRIISKKNKAT